MPVPERVTTRYMGRLDWDGDDLRWWRRWKRRLQRGGGFFGGDGVRATPVRTSLVITSLVLYLYQTLSTVNFIRRAYPQHWPHQAGPILVDALFGSSVRGPVTMAFAFSNALSHSQPHRFLASGFLHGGLIPLLLNIDHLRRQPSWLETGLGWSLYLTTLLLCIVTGNMGQLYFGNGGPYDKTLYLGLSGGISGLYGLMFVCLQKMRNPGAFGRIIKGIVILMFTGVFFESVSGAVNLGGFLGGMAIGILCGPQYRKSYTLRRKNSVEYDPTPRDYRQVLGFGTMPTERGWIPVPLLWWVVLVAFGVLAVVNPSRFGTMPQLMLRGLLKPESLTR